MTTHGQWTMPIRISQTGMSCMGFWRVKRNATFMSRYKRKVNNMETNKAVIGALLFIVLVIGANFVMYAIARGAAKSNQRSFLETISKSLNTSTQKKDT